MGTKTQDVTIVDEAGNDFVDVIDDAGTKRLAVDAKVSAGSVSVSRFRPRVFETVTEQTINTAQEVTLLDISGDGQIDWISINFEKSDWEAILEVDGVEIYRINLKDLKDFHKLTDAEDYVHRDASSEFVDKYPTPVDFVTGFKVKAKNVAGSSKKIRAILVRYRLII